MNVIKDELAFFRGYVASETIKTEKNNALTFKLHGTTKVISCICYKRALHDIIKRHAEKQITVFFHATNLKIQEVLTIEL